MLEHALEVLRVIENGGYNAYLVGGCVRDYLLGNDIIDIDICTNATPLNIRKLFGSDFIKSEQYGSIVLIYKNIRYEITTFRKEGLYLNNRKPISYEYVEELEIDLQRRDFTVNTICMDKDKKIIDLYNGIKDLENGIIRSVSNPKEKFSEDALRMLRAIRFATILNFKLDESIIDSIKSEGSLISNISYERKKMELDKIFLSNNIEYGIKLLHDTNLDLHLELDFNNISIIDDIIGIWAQLRTINYRFTKSELKIIKDVNEIIDNKIDVFSNFTLYKYGLYVCMLVAKIQKLDIALLSNMYRNIPIESKNDIRISADTIKDVLGINEGHQLRSVYNKIINKILALELLNDTAKIIEYLKSEYNVLK